VGGPSKTERVKGIGRGRGVGRRGVVNLFTPRKKKKREGLVQKEVPEGGVCERGNEKIILLPKLSRVKPKLGG